VSTQTVLPVPEVEFEELLEAWERFLDALVYGNAVPAMGRGDKLERAERPEDAPPVLIAQTGGAE